MDRAPGTEELWRLALERMPIGMGRVGPDGRFLMVNHALCDLLGYEPDQLRSMRLQDITHPDDFATSLTSLEKTLEGEIDSVRLCERYLRADGGAMWADVSLVPVRQEDGTALEFVTQFIDVTEQQAAAERLAAANRELDFERRTLEAIFDTVDVGLLLLGTDGSYQRMNRRHAETLRLLYPQGHQGRAGQPGAIYGPDGRTLLASEEQPSYRALQGEEFDDVLVWFGADPDHRAAFSVSARRVRDHNGAVTGSALAYKEVTDLVRALQVMDEFVSSVSHELRTPLVSVLGHLELLTERDDLPSGVQRQLEVIERNALRLRALVSDLLQMARAVDGGPELQRTKTDIVALVEDTVEDWRPRADAAGLTLRSNTPPTLVAAVDGARLRQVVDSLVSNAVNYTEPGGKVTIGLRGDDHQVRLSVSDTGVGMDEAELKRAFTWFVRGDQAVQRQIPGTGLGLNLASIIVAAHGGEITAESTPGQGSTFHVTLLQSD